MDALIQIIEAYGLWVVLIDRPNDASAALVARQLQTQGLSNARPLAGGIEGWRALGLPVVTA